MTYLAAPEVLTTLDDVVEALKAGTNDPSDSEQIARDDALFAERAHAFYQAYWEEIQRRGLDRAPNSWPPLPALVALEQEFLLRGKKSGDLDDDKAGDYYAATRTVRDFITWRQRDLAKLN
jgi:hypothetical protein